MKSWTAGLLGAVIGAATTAAVMRAGQPGGSTEVFSGTTALASQSTRPAAVEMDAPGVGDGGARQRSRGSLEEAERLRQVAALASPAVAAELRRISAERDSIEAELLEAREQLQRAIDPDRRVRPYDLSAEQKQALAKKCALTWDMPSPGGKSVVNKDDAARLGLDEGARLVMDAVLRDNDAWLDGEVSRLYAEITGDAKAGGELSIEAKWREIEDKTPREELIAVFQRISAERAGMPVARGGDGSVAARLFRILVANGDRVEQGLAAKVGPEVARRYRDLHNGFSGRWTSTYGCPREDGTAPGPATADGLPGAGERGR